ncbi:MAG: thiamine pyrophosphate-binding protein [Desulfobulbaceae bacterium]
MNTAELIVRTLTRLGTRYIFGIPGGAIEDLNTAIFNEKELIAIVTKHEEGAAFMADGFARVSGELGVCCATSGPGASNLITGLASAYADSIPVLALTGQVATSVFGKGALQESGAEGVNMVSIFKTFTKYSGMLINEKRAQYMIQKAIRSALSGPRGPVHLNLPINMMKKEVNDQVEPALKAAIRLFDRQGVKEAARKLVTAKHPVIIAGWGVSLSRGAYELLELAQLLQVPVATSPKGKGVFPENHPLSLGVLGFAGNPAASQYIIDEDVDVMLAVGTSFNEMMTTGWNHKLAPSDALIHIDINHESIGKNYAAEIGLEGDARATLKELSKEILEERSARGIKVTSLADRIARLKSRERENDAKTEVRETSLYHPMQLVRDLRTSCPEETIFFADMGNIMAWATRYMTFEVPYCFYMAMGFGSMGYAVAAPVGAKLARPDRPVVAMVGDGSFQMNGFEVATAVNYNIPVVWVVFNNSMLGMVYHGRRLFKNRIPDGLTPHFQQVDFAKVAEGLGARGIRVEKPGEITPEFMAEILREGRPTVIDVLIDKEAVPPIHARIKTVEGLT